MIVQKKGIIAKSEEYKGSDYSWVIYSFYRIPEYVKDYAESQTSWKKLKGQMQKNYALEWEKKAQDFLTNLEQDTEVIVEIESKNGCVELVNVHSLEDKKNISDKITKIAQTAKDVAVIALSDHLEKVKKLHEENEFLQNQNKKLQEEFENRFGDNDQYRLDLEEEQLELMIKNEELSEENKALLDEFLLMQQQHKALQLQLLQSQKKKYDYLKDRVTIYKNIVFEKDSFDEFVLLTEDDNRNVEERIQLLNHKPDDVNFRCKIAGTNFLEIGFGSQGRMYVKKVGNCYHIYKIGNKATQTNDIKYLKTIS